MSGPVRQNQPQVQQSSKLSTSLSQQPTSTPPRKQPNAWGRNSPSLNNPRSPPPQPIPAPSVQNSTSLNSILPNGGFPPLLSKSPPPPSNDSLLVTFGGMINAPISIFLRTGSRHSGTLSSVTTPNDKEEGVTLSNVRDLLNPSAPLQKELYIRLADVEGWNPASSAPPQTAAVPNGNGFRTDTDISHRKPPPGGTNSGPPRELQSFYGSQSPPPHQPPSLPVQHQSQLSIDDLTFGPAGSGPTKWDQFAANEEMFGVTTSFDEHVYTTRLDRNQPGFREREKEAERLAGEIMSNTTTGNLAGNVHMAEERGLKVDDSGLNEEDKYSGVSRAPNPNAYVPPGRRQNSNPGTGTGGAGTPKEVQTPPPTTTTTPAIVPPKVNVSMDGTPAPSTPGAAQAQGKGPEHLVDEFRVFVTNERQRLSQKRAAIAKSEMDKRKADLINFSLNFKLNKPIPKDLVPILAKDEDKQRVIVEKTKTDALSAGARAIGPSITASAPLKGGVVAKGSTPPSNVTITKGGEVKEKEKKDEKEKEKVKEKKEDKSATTTTSGATKKPIRMTLQAIPPFNPKKARDPSAVGMGASASAPKISSEENDAAVAAAKEAALKESASAASRLNINAMSFKPNPNANSFKPTASPSSSTAATPQKEKEVPAAPSAPNPFFGTRVPKKSAVAHVKEDFNPFKHGPTVAAASSVAALWPYTGKRYMMLFPPPPSLIIQPQQPPSQQQQPPPPQMMQQPPPPQMQPQPQQPPPPVPPPSVSPSGHYDEGGGGGGYVYYAPYPYPGQPHQQMMPVGGVPPPPGQYIPAPYMQAIPYPANMPPPPNMNGAPMYAPPMGGMPPPHFMAPPPGAYPQPPNGNGPRPSLPPTPVPQHTHPYPYHQSPQIAHAIPYGAMMMQHPGQQQHVYDANAGGGGGQQPPPPPVTMVNHS